MWRRSGNVGIAIALALAGSACGDGAVGEAGAGGATGLGGFAATGAAGGATSSTPGAGGDGTTGHGAGGAGGAPISCPGADVFVAPDGQGVGCTCAAPCSLEAGRDRARALAATAKADVVVEVADGTYRLAQTLFLGSQDSGPAGHATVYRAAAGAHPVWSGAVRVTGFAPAASPAGALVATVPKGTHARQLWVDGRRATRARGPGAAAYVKTATGFTLGAPAMASWPDRGGLELVGTNQWRMFRCPVDAVTNAGITVAASCWAAAQKGGQYGFDAVAWVENAIELLDQPGEFFLDDAGGQLFYHPREGEDPNQVDVELPAIEEILRLEGTPAAPVHDVAFEGITFAFATWTAPSGPDGYLPVQASVRRIASGTALEKPLANVTVHAGHHVRFDGCTFTHLGGAGLAIEAGAHDDVVQSCWFEDISSSAVFVGDVTHEDDHHPKDPALVVRDNAVDGSYVTRAGAEYFDAARIFVGFTMHTSLTNDEIFDVPYSGISVGWGWGAYDVGGKAGYATPTTSKDNVIERNVVSHHMRRLRDGGAIYVLGAQPGSTMKGNVVSNQAAPYGNLYLDNGTQGYTVSGNVVRVYPKQDVADDPSYWLYVQVYPAKATNDVVGTNYTNDGTLLHPEQIDPSNTITAPSPLGGAAMQAIVTAAGSPLVAPNVAAGKAVKASSTYDAGHGAKLAANDDAFDGWSPASGDKSPWWQVDLGAPHAIEGFEVVSRWALDQPSTRRDYRVVASADEAFTAPVVLGSVDHTGVPNRAIVAGRVSPPVVARYVRVEKTAKEYFFLGEVRVRGRPTN